MSKEQIEEMAKIICGFDDEECEHCNTCSFHNGCAAEIDAENIYNAGYRKPSEVIEEYRKKVYSKMEKYTVFGREYIQRIMREVEKEMEGGAE